MTKGSEFDASFDELRAAMIAAIEEGINKARTLAEESKLIGLERRRELFLGRIVNGLAMKQMERIVIASISPVKVQEVEPLPNE